MTTGLVSDVTVIGGGPAGSVFATRMAHFGLEVCLIERARFPRPHLGESLSPGVMPLLSSMGSAELVEAAGFPRVRAVSTNWQGQEAVRHDPREQGMLVDRGAFDTILLGHAASAGVGVLQPAQVRHLEPAAGGWRLRLDGPAGAMDLHTRFLADASGRSARLGGRRRAMGPRTIAIHGYWTGKRLPSRPRIEAGEAAWYWGVPIPDGSYNTLVFVDGERFRAEPAGSLEERLLALLAGSALMREVEGARLRGPVRAADATPYVVDDAATASRIRLGDAALALDPLSSSGVQKAIQTALSGAVVANTLLRRPHDAEAAIRFYQDSLTGAAERHRFWASSHYAAAASWRCGRFWTARADSASPVTSAEAVDESPMARTVEDDVPVRLSRESTWEAVPCLGAAYVEMKTALRHPGLDGPVAYLGGQELAPLLGALRPGMTLRQLTHTWAGTVPPGMAASIVRWLSRRGIVEPVPVPG